MIRADDPGLLASLREHEGWRSKPYRCTAGALTIGYGHNLDANPVDGATLGRWQREGMTRDEGNALLVADVLGALADCERWSWVGGLPEAAQRVVVEMVFQLGATRFSRFARLLDALAARDYRRAAAEMRDSAWYRQTTRRAETLAGRMEALEADT